MSFNLFYSVPGRRQRFISMPDLYLEYVSNEDTSQLSYGLRQHSNNEPAVSTVRDSAIKLAKQRKEGKS